MRAISHSASTMSASAAGAQRPRARRASRRGTPGRAGEIGAVEPVVAELQVRGAEVESRCAAGRGRPPSRGCCRCRDAVRHAPRPSSTARRRRRARPPCRGCGSAPRGGRPRRPAASSARSGRRAPRRSRWSSDSGWKNSVNKRGSSPSCTSTAIRHRALLTPVISTRTPAFAAALPRNRCSMLTPSAQEVRAPGLAAQVDLEPERLVFPHEPVIDRLERSSPYCRPSLRCSTGVSSGLPARPPKTASMRAASSCERRARRARTRGLPSGRGRGAAREYVAYCGWRLRQRREPAVHLVHRRPRRRPSPAARDRSPRPSCARAPARSARRLGVSAARDSRVPRRTMMPIIWFVTSSADSSPSRCASGKLTSTAMITSTPISRARLTGRLSTSPPSTSRRPPISTGASTPAPTCSRAAPSRGRPSAAPRARRSRGRSQARGTASAAGRSPARRPTRIVALRSTWVIFWPCTSPSGSTTPSPARKPSAPRARKLRSSCLRRIHEVLARRAVAQQVLPVERAEDLGRSPSPLRPAAYSPPTTAPMLVPATASIGMRISSSARMTPTCAAPRAPPPLSTRPMRGRSAAGPRARRRPSARRTVRQGRAHRRPATRFGSTCASLPVEWPRY